MVGYFGQRLLLVSGQFCEETFHQFGVGECSGYLIYQFVLALGVSYATRTLVQAAALAVGVALYSINWRRAFGRFGRRPATVAPT